MQLHEKMISVITIKQFQEIPIDIHRIPIGISNEVYNVRLKDKEVIIRLSSETKFLKGSSKHIPELNKLGIHVPQILVEDYSKKIIPLAYQIQTKILGLDLGLVIEKLTKKQLKKLAYEIVAIFNKIKTIAPIYNKYGLVWGQGENDFSDSWTERMNLWIDESIARGQSTGIIDDVLIKQLKHIYTIYKPYFDSVKPVTYFGDISSKNVMILDGKLNGLVDLDGLTQGDPLEAIGRIKIAWYGTSYGTFYTKAIMDEMQLDKDQQKIITVYAVINQVSLLCENGIQFNQNTRTVIDRSQENRDKEIINMLVAELHV